MAHRPRPIAASAYRVATPARLDFTPAIGFKVRFLFDDLRSQPLIDPPLHYRATVVFLVDGTHQLDETWIEVRGSLAQLNLILNPPERLVDRLELAIAGRADRRSARELNGRGGIGPAVTKQSKPLTGPDPLDNRA
jgi:hypothetical protein